MAVTDRPVGGRDRGSRSGGRRGWGSLRTRRALSWTLGIAGLAAYNWWLLVPLKPGLMTSPDELFSNLEVSGQPYAALMQHADVAAGVLLLAAFLMARHSRSAADRREWLAMLAFAAAGALGGLFPEVCADGISAVCRRMEWRFQLPASQYVHDVAGILEFAAITIALACAVSRTRRQRTSTARWYRALAVGALVAYPLLGAAYLVNRLGGVMEGVFFAGFTIMVVTVLADWTRFPDGSEPDQAVVGHYRDGDVHDHQHGDRIGRRAAMQDVEVGQPEH
jgi:Protein of unknown function (DUF998)